MSTVVFTASALLRDFCEIIRKRTINLVLKNIFADFPSLYFEEIELTRTFFAAEYCTMTSER